MDFFQIGTKETKGGIIEVFPDFMVGRSKDLMVRGRSFYAIWDEEAGLWSMDEYDVQRLVDKELAEFAEKLRQDGHICTVKYLRSFGSNSWNQFRSFVNNLSDNSHQLDQTSYIRQLQRLRRKTMLAGVFHILLLKVIQMLGMSLLGTLYSPEERAKIEWAIGAVVAREIRRKSRNFIVLYGPAGTGKSTILEYCSRSCLPGTPPHSKQRLWEVNNASFATEVFKSNPLVAIQHDGDCVED
jgi:hypothetical protein